jgi:Zn-dependent peptidase ImmA (M78 family)
MLKFPFDPVKAVEYLPNCHLRSYQKFAKEGGVTVDEVTRISGSKLGCANRLKGGLFVILLNNDKSILLERRMFVLAHEIGHIAAGHFDDLLEDALALESESEYKTVERQANHFAAMLLCPTPVLSKINPSYPSEIASKFRLSYEAAKIAFGDYKRYDPSYNITWHNGMLELFGY